ncbi:hypothetical protein TNCT_13621 [Trichonephila clavata]|uniref:Uncharacterized protein n=1 Tax=Trichonephila clavata TaxID=2740835 RepID=A0A8X6EYC2_TRICU|nr:hypothetical protein TNCT_13621 [Trichonephila clavata]
MSVQAQEEESRKSVFNKYEEYSKKHFESIQNHRNINNSDPNNGCINSIHNGIGMSQQNGNDFRIWNEVLANFKKWSDENRPSEKIQQPINTEMTNVACNSTDRETYLQEFRGSEEYLRALKMTNQVSERIAHDITIEDSGASGNDSCASVFNKLEKWPRGHFESIQKNKQVNNNDTNDASFHSVEYTFGPEHHNRHEMSQLKMNDGRSWYEFFSDFEKWIKDYYLSLQMKNDVSEEMAHGIPIIDSSVTKRFEIPLRTSVGQHEVRVREELSKQQLGSFPESASVCFPNNTSSFPCNLCCDGLLRRKPDRILKT